MIALYWSKICGQPNHRGLHHTMTYYGKPKGTKFSYETQHQWHRVTLCTPKGFGKMDNLELWHSCVSGEMPFLSDSHGPSARDSLCLPDHRNYASPLLASGRSMGQDATTHLEHSLVESPKGMLNTTYVNLGEMTLKKLPSMVQK